MDKQSNLRLILALAISFAVIFIWSKFFSEEAQKPNQSIDSKTQQTTTHSTNDAPKVPTINTINDAKNNEGNSSENIIATIKSAKIQMQIDNLGRIKQVYLKEDKYTQPSEEGILNHILKLFGANIGQSREKLSGLPLFDKNSGAYPLEIRFINKELNSEAFHTNYTSNVKELELGDSPETITLTQELKNLKIEKIITINPDLTYSLKIHLSEAQSYVLSNGMRPVADGENYAFNGVILKNKDKKIEKIEDKDAKRSGEIFDNVSFIASVDRYYTTLLYDDKSHLQTVVSAYGEKNYPLPFINVYTKDIELKGYIGPKDYEILKSIDKNLTSVIEYGLITFFAKYVFLLLNYLYSYVNNWGVAIILLVIIIRIILFPLTFKGMVGMQKLKDLAPKMKELQVKYKGEPQKLQASMMELYKKHGANPLGGCLPLILQIPVFFAIYRVLYNAVELKYADFLFWIHDLSVMDPYFVLPILMGVSMYLQQHLTPNTMTDPMQQKIFKFLPVVFTLFLITFPAGLTLYWTINNVFSILQQLAINKMLDNKKEKEIQAHKKHKQVEIK